MGDETSPGAQAADINDVMEKLDVTDVEFDEGDEEDLGSRDLSDKRSSSASSGGHSDTGACAEEAQNGSVPQDPADAQSFSERTVKGKSGGSLKDKKPLRFLKKLVSRGDKDKDKDKGNSGSGADNADSHLENVKVDGLPQVFVTKYLGSQTCKGLWGIRSTRAPVEDMIEQVQHLKEGEELPLVQLRISQSGVHIREHSANKCTSQSVAKELIPIEFISYGVQDIKYTRVFAFILVREMSSRAKKLECHAYVCDSTLSARRLALSLSLAFKEYAASLEGKPFRFQVDLRPADELEKDLTTPDRDADIEV